MGKDRTHEEEAAPADQGLPPSGTGHQSGNAREENDRRIAAEHFNLVPPTAPLQPVSFAILITRQSAAALSEVKLNNPYDILA